MSESASEQPQGFQPVHTIAFLSLFVALFVPSLAHTAIPPAESAKAFAWPVEMEIEPTASEPLIHAPSGVCWDERKRMCKADNIMTNLAGVIAVHGDSKEITESITELEAASIRAKSLNVLKLGLEDTKQIANNIGFLRSVPAKGS